MVEPFQLNPVQQVTNHQLCERSQNIHAGKKQPDPRRITGESARETAAQHFIVAVDREVEDHACWVRDGHDQQQADDQVVDAGAGRSFLFAGQAGSR